MFICQLKCKGHFSPQSTSLILGFTALEIIVSYTRNYVFGNRIVCADAVTAEAFIYELAGIAIAGVSDKGACALVVVFA